MHDALPAVGLGTMGVEEPAVVETALDVGYRHLDTAQIYHNEHVVGAGLAASDVPRADVTVATKLWVDSLAPGAVGPSAAASRARLGVEAIDLLYVHRPRGPYDPAGTLAAVDRLVDEGTVRAAGVSNFDVEGLDEAIERLDAPLVAHQTELHPLFRRPALLSHAREHGYAVVAYSPLAGGRVADLPEVVAVAEKHDATPAAVTIAWLTGLENVVVVPKASSRAHLEANLAAAALELDPVDVERIEGVEREEELFPE
jgi:2,5-diketo-D-gluconate reductase B